MANKVFITTSNYTGNARYEYTFPTQVDFKEGDTIEMVKLVAYNSVFNVESARSNNTVSLKWTDISGTTQYDFTIPDGFYDVNGLNYFLQQQCILNNLYVNLGNGDSVYFIGLTTNPSRYACQINVFPLPTSAQATTLGYTKPSGATWDYPATAKTPQIIISNNFGLLLGINAGTYPPAIQATAIQYLSAKQPVIQPVFSWLVTCNLIYSPYSNPNNILTSMAIDKPFGSLMEIENNNSTPLQIRPNTKYNSIIIELLDPVTFNPLRIHDSELTMELNIRTSNKK